MSVPTLARAGTVKKTCAPFAPVLIRPAMPIHHSKAEANAARRTTE
jgi:hypothetical protein